jgi:hypothetical protein
MNNKLPTILSCLLSVLEWCLSIFDFISFTVISELLQGTNCLSDCWYDQNFIGRAACQFS